MTRVTGALAGSGERYRHWPRHRSAPAAVVAGGALTAPKRGHAPLPVLVDEGLARSRFEEFKYL